MEVAQRLSTYVASRYELAPDITVESGATTAEGCFRGCSFERQHLSVLSSYIYHPTRGS
jgi:hypothetical protein